MKKKLVTLLALGLAVASITACGKSESSSTVESSSSSETGEETVYNEDGSIYSTTDESLLPDVDIEETALDDIIEKLENLDLSDIDWFSKYEVEETSYQTVDNYEYLSNKGKFYEELNRKVTYVPSQIGDLEGAALFETTDSLEISYRIVSGKLSNLKINYKYTGHTDEYIKDADTTVDDVVALLLGEENAEQLKEMYYNQSTEITYGDNTVNVIKIGQVDGSTKETVYEFTTTDLVVEANIEEVEYEFDGFGYANSIEELQNNISEDFGIENLTLQVEDVTVYESSEYDAYTEIYFSVSIDGETDYLSSITIDDSMVYIILKTDVDSEDLMNAILERCSDNGRDVDVYVMATDTEGYLAAVIMK